MVEGVRREGSDWRREARAAAYAYPGLAAELQELRRVKLSSGLGGAPKGTGAQRPSETAALRELPGDLQAKHDAVAAAMSQVGRLHRGGLRRQLVVLVYFRRSHTVYGAAAALGVSENTAKRWNADFLLAVSVGLKKTQEI